ncbi:hypothetical protein NK718_21425 [Alsobacter sp. SYSU M60028]|uniref:Type III secretion system (T3SS) negative regulator GrlR n=1 Tax=Alsobacter ponti TaxID=2962936 RepID=A0ABT1LK28_9HYPH|nr:hypothetical protein [Alsobacter ponti]MCP8941090.1 hypothetical protein [Alsobacter ponti]
MRDGLYRVEYIGRTAEGYGIAHLAGGRIWGGDSVAYFTGTYRREGNNLIVRVKSDFHSEIEGVESVLGRIKNTIKFEGVCTDTEAEIEGRSDQASGIPLKVKIVWLAE